VPEELMADAKIFGMQDIRAFSGIASESFKQDFIELIEQERRQHPGFKGRKTYSVLAISGGAANGAYGAGLLSGWSQAGTRPVFKVVTGISTGAIIAPIVFLGSGYDYMLKDLYTKYSTKDIATISIPFVNSITSTHPLAKLIGQYFDKELLEQIAIEYKKGRRLYVGTTNLDAERLVIWDMGKIASIGGDDGLKLFQKIILASASIPIVFPPVYLNVDVKGKTYDEMHVDGGISKQVFFVFDVLEGFHKALREKRLDVSSSRYEIYVIRNGYIDPVYREVPDKITAIAARTVSALTNAQSLGDIYQLYLFARDSNGDFNLAYIPPTHSFDAKEFFDPAIMKELFDLGYLEGKNGYAWRKTPPGIIETRPKNAQQLFWIRRLNMIMLFLVILLLIISIIAIAKKVHKNLLKYFLISLFLILLITVVWIVWAAISTGEM